MRFVFLIIIILFLAAVAVFALQNFQTVTVAFANLQLTAPLAVLVGLVYVLGMATGGGLFSFLGYTIHKATAARAPRTPLHPPEREPKIIDHAP